MAHHLVDSFDEYDDDDDDQVKDGDKKGSTTNSASGEVEEETRDEVKEVLKFSENHTSWMRRIRVVVFLLLFLTGAAVSTTAYILSLDEQRSDFLLAVSR